MRLVHAWKKAFNPIPFTVLGLDREKLLPHRVSVFFCGDDPEAKATVKLAEELGFVGIDGAGLEHARLIYSLADFIRLQISVIGLGLFATISVNVLPEASR